MDDCVVFIKTDQLKEQVLQQNVCKQGPLDPCGVFVYPDWTLNFILLLLLYCTVRQLVLVLSGEKENPKCSRSDNQMLCMEVKLMLLHSTNILSCWAKLDDQINLNWKSQYMCQQLC